LSKNLVYLRKYEDDITLNEPIGEFVDDSMTTFSDALEDNSSAPSIARLSRRLSDGCHRLTFSAADYNLPKQERRRTYSIGSSQMVSSSHKSSSRAHSRSFDFEALRNKPRLETIADNPNDDSD
jgi:hypothetical protein